MLLQRLRRLRWGRVVRGFVVLLALAQLARFVASMVQPTPPAVVPTASHGAASLAAAAAARGGEASRRENWADDASSALLLSEEGLPASAGHATRSARPRRRPGAVVVAGSTGVPAWRRLPLNPHLPAKEADDHTVLGGDAHPPAAATGPRLVPSFIIAGESIMAPAAARPATL
jgi:hypothetical protein